MSSSDVSAVVNYFPSPNEGFTTTLGSTISSGASSVPLNGTTGLTNGQIFVGIIEPGGTNQQVFTGTVDISGAQITGVKWTRGANVAHAGGVTIVDYVTGTALKMISTGILKQHTQTGAHTGLVTDTFHATSTSTVDGVANFKGGIQSNGVTFDGAWTSWTPTRTNITVGNGTETARSVQIGKTVHFVYMLVLGSTSAIGSTPQITLPVVAASYQKANSFIVGRGGGLRSGVTDVQLGLVYNSGDNFGFIAMTASGSFADLASTVSATNPFTWAAGDVLRVIGTYEAA